MDMDLYDFSQSQELKDTKIAEDIEEKLNLSVQSTPDSQVKVKTKLCNLMDK